MFDFKKIFQGFSRRVKSTGTFTAIRSGEEFTLNKNNFGVVYADVSAIQKVVVRSADSVAGITKASVSIDRLIKNSPLKIHFTLELEQNFSVNDVSRDLVSAVKSDLEKIFAIIEVEIYARITDVTKSAEKPKRRVR